MAALNPAVDAQPGWRGTDPNGGTWVRCEPSQYGEWEVHDSTPGLGFRARSARQEEAEAAGLVEMVADDGVVDAEVIDPDDPAQLERAATLLAVLQEQGCIFADPEMWGATAVRGWLTARADDLREAAQGAKDRERAEAYARAEAEGEHRAIGGWSAMRADIREWHIALALRVIRAERTKEAGRC